MKSTPITQTFIVRQKAEPDRRIDGMLWINPEGGQNNNNSERYIWNKDASQWELTNSVGPDTPKFPATGAFWRDTANGKQKAYDGSSWKNVGVTDHSNLQNVTANQHHSKDPAYVDSGTSTEIQFSWSGSGTISETLSIPTGYLVYGIGWTHVSGSSNNEIQAIYPPGSNTASWEGGLNGTSSPKPCPGSDGGSITIEAYNSNSQSESTTWEFYFHVVNNLSH